MSDKRKYRKSRPSRRSSWCSSFFAGTGSIADICCEHDISETLLRRWRNQMVVAAAERFQDRQERSVAAEQRRRIAELEWTLGNKTYEPLQAAHQLLVPEVAVSAQRRRAAGARALDPRDESLDEPQHSARSARRPLAQHSSPRRPDSSAGSTGRGFRSNPPFCGLPWPPH